MVKKKFHYDFSYNYMEEVDFPTIRQKWFLLHTDPVWYRFILSGIVVEALTIFYMTAFQIEMFSYYHTFIVRIQHIFNFMYAVDITLAIRQKFFFKYRYPYPNPIRRPAPVMMMEIVSVIPFGMIIDWGTTDVDRSIYVNMSTLHVLKVTRFCYHVYNNRRDQYNEFRTRVLELIIIYVLFTGLFVHVLNMIVHLDRHDGIYEGFQLITSSVAGRGGGGAWQSNSTINRQNAYQFEMITSWIAIFMWTVTIFPNSCFMILSATENHQHRHDYAYLINLFRRKIVKKLNLRPETTKTMMDYFSANWRLKGGFNDMEFEFAQRSLKVEIAMDTFWPAFKHSVLFRQTEFYILRALAEKIDRRIRMEGEFIYSKNKKKLGMIYIVQGVVEVLSAENDESGIVCLTAGTCIGEASLIIPHVSSVNFRCKTVCEVFELPRKKFMEFEQSYPSEYKQLQLKLLEILKKVRVIKEYNSRFNRHDAERNRMIWLKYQLHNLMSYSATYKNTHEQANPYLRNELEDVVRRQRHVFHTFEYLDKLAIRERTLTDVDLVFIRNTCPWILKAGSPITNLLETISAIMSICCSLVVSYGFCISYTPTIALITTAIHVFFIFDLVVQFITPVSPTSDARTLTAVMVERLRTTGFFLDVMSVFYWKMIAFVLDTERPWFELFKLAKLWRLINFFEHWSHKFLLSRIRFVMVLSLCIYLGWIYFLCCFFTLTKVTDKMMTAVTIQFATGAGLPFPIPRDSPVTSFVYVFANGLSLIVQLVVTALMCSAFYLEFISNLKIVTSLHTLNQWVRFQKRSWLAIRLNAYFNVVRVETDIRLSQGNISHLFALPPYFEILMKSTIHVKALKRLTLFKNLSDDFVRNLLMNTEVFTCYNHSIIISRGVIYKDVFVVMRGECRTLIAGRYQRTKCYEPLNFLENCYKFPAVNSTMALSDCDVLKFNFEAFVHCLYESPVDYKAYTSTVSLLKEHNEAVMLKFLYGPIMIIRSRIRKPNFKQFHMFAPKNSFEEFDYHVPFDKIRPFSFVKFFLLKTTFYPEGQFLKSYEFVRCTVAFASAIAFTIPAINVGAYTKRSRGYPLMLALDLFAVLDIYVRMHVGYYQSNGVLVTHPLKTAKHYMTHGFVIDLIAMFPLDIFPMKVQYRVFLNAIHALQMHRIDALRRYYATNNLYYILNTVSIISFILFSANFIAGLLFVYDCYDFDTEEQVPEAQCRIFKFEKTEAHFHILFLVLSALQCSGMRGKIDVVDLDGLLVFTICLLAVIGVLTQILYKAYIFSNYISRIIEKYEYVVGVRRLIRLLQQSNVNKYLCKEVAFFYDLHWTRVASQDMEFITKNMVSALKRDMLFKFYGDNLVVYSIFNENIMDTTLFIKNIFLAAKFMVVPKNGYVVTINDIDAYIYFLNKGSVDILGVDGAKFQELTAGAMFGNFSGQKYTRMKLSIVANVNTDLVYVPAMDFYTIINYFPKIKASFEAMIKKKVYYIEGIKPIEPQLTMSFEEYIGAVNQYSFMMIINYVHLLFVCYLGISMELYQLAVGELHVAYLSIQYGMDALHLLREYLKYRLPYKDEHRAPIFEAKAIVAYQVAKRAELYITIITVIYLDLFLILPYLFFARYELINVTYLFTFFRLNRLFRLFYVSSMHTEAQVRVSHVSSNLAKWLYVIYWYILSYQVVAAITAIFDSLTTEDSTNLIHNIEPQKIKNLRYLPSLQKLDIYARYFFFANLIHINGNHEDYGPRTTAFNIYMIVLYMYRLVVDALLLCRFFEAIIDLVILRRLYLKGVNFLKFYISKSTATHVVKDRVMENSTHAWSKHYYKSDHIMDVVCANYLREVICNALYGYLFRRHPVLSHTHLDFLRQLGVHLKRVIYPCNYVVVYKKEVRKCMFFIHKGVVAAYDMDFGYHEMSRNTLAKGNSFGFLQGLGRAGALYEFTYITTSHCEIMELEWDSWNYLLEFFPATKEYIFGEAENYRGLDCVQFLENEILREYW